MKVATAFRISLLSLFVSFTFGGQQILAQSSDDKGAPTDQIGTHFSPFIWPSEPPADCPFELSKEFTNILFLGVHSDYSLADTWYPSWASDGNLYSPWTDGGVPRLDGSREGSGSGEAYPGGPSTTGQAVMEGDDPLNLKIYSLGLSHATPAPYQGRYPCGSLVYNGVWYYSTYCLAPAGTAHFGGQPFNWPWLGPVVGFRTSTDLGRSWTDTKHTPAKPLFGETGMWGYPVKIGAPHFVDFGKNMEHSPDGKAYLVAHGASYPDPKPRFGNLSWISGDEIYLIRVTPSIETINDPSAYEFFGGHDDQGNPVWTHDFEKIKPLVDWNNNTGCVTITYNAPLKKYLMCVTDGWPTVAKMNSYILEADKITGPWKMVSYMKDLGEQAYFLNIPTKFISDDGKTMWLCYSGNFANWGGVKIEQDPPGSHYGLVFQKIKLLSDEMVLVPTITPFNSNVLPSDPVSIECGTEGATIRYTLDGSEPTEKSKAYKRPIKIKESCVVKARAFKEGVTPSFTTKSILDMYDRDVNSLNYEYYTGTWSIVPDFDELTPEKTGVIGILDMDQLNTREHSFGIRFHGWIDIPGKGNYTFFVNSDDGSKFYIDNTEVVNNDGLHGDHVQSGEIELTAGRHPFVLEYFQGGNGKALKLSWEGPGIDKQRVGASRFYTSNN